MKSVIIIFILLIIVVLVLKRNKKDMIVINTELKDIKNTSDLTTYTVKNSSNIYNEIKSCL